MRWRLLIILTAAAFLQAYSQRAIYSFDHISQQQGLLHNQVAALAQDALGFMWVITKNGVQRYDGLHFKNYMQGLTGASTLYCDDKGNVWVEGTNTACYNIYTNRTTIYSDSGLLGSPAFQPKEYRDENNQRWLLGNFALYRKDSVGEKAKKVLAFMPNFPGKLGNTVAYDKAHGYYWVFVQQKGLMLFDSRTKKIFDKHYNPVHHPLLQEFTSKLITTLFVDADANTWIGGWSGDLYKYDAASGRLSTYLLQGSVPNNAAAKTRAGSIACIYQDSKGMLWVGADRGLFSYNTAADSFVNIQAAVENDEGWPALNAGRYCITGDKEGNLWIGTGDGIDIFNPYRQVFQGLRHQQNNAASLPAHEIISVYPAASGDVYITTWGGGFSIFDSALHFKKSVCPKGDADMAETWCTAETGSRVMYIGTQHGYLHVYDELTGVLKTLRPAELEHSTVRCMIADESGNIWMGLHNGQLVEREKITGRFIKTGNASFNNRQVYAIAKDSLYLWATTDNGLLQFDSKQHRYIMRYNINGDVKTQLTRAIEMMNDSVLAVTTEGGGLVFFNKRSKQFFRAPATEQLNNRNLFSITKDSVGRLWMTGDYQLYCYDENAQKLMAFMLPAGLVRSSFDVTGIGRFAGGRLITATTTEAIAFAPQMLYAGWQNNTKPFIGAMRAGGKEIFTDSFILFNKPLVLTAGDNFITISLAPLSYTRPLQQLYYQMAGIDNNWVTAGEEGVASYTNLSPGHYLFNMRSGNNKNIVQLSIIIKPPFYLTAWFIALVTASIVIIGYLIIRRRFKTIRNEAELKHRISAAEMAALRAQMNPHFIFNCLNAIDNLIQTNQKEKATTYLHRFARLIRGVLDSSKHNLVPMHKDVDIVKLYLELERFRCNNAFNYTLEVEPALQNGDYKIPPLVIQPFLENAIHHGLMNKEEGNRCLQVVICLDKEAIKYTITDNGVGRKQAGQLRELNKPGHESYGIQISAGRIQMHNGRSDTPGVMITDVYEDGKPAGTVVEFLIKTDI